MMIEPIKNVRESNNDLSRRLKERAEIERKEREEITKKYSEVAKEVARRLIIKYDK